MPSAPLVGPLASQEDSRSVRRAWFAVAAIPIAFVIAMVEGEGLITAGWRAEASPARMRTSAAAIRQCSHRQRHGNAGRYRR